MNLISALRTHIGRRANNEDKACNEPSLGLYAIADGMGGYEGGEVASDIAIHTLKKFVLRNRSDQDCTWPYKLDLSHSLQENLLLTATQLASDQIKLQRIGKLVEMGSTIVAMMTVGSQAIVAHVGDSRLYRVRTGKLEQLTRDHSLYEELCQHGGEVPSRADFRHGNIITRALGLRGLGDVSTCQMHAEDVFILCSDGLSDVVDDDCILKAATSLTDPSTLCESLVNMAYSAGGRDNITVLVVRCQG